MTGLNSIVNLKIIKSIEGILWSWKVKTSIEMHKYGIFLDSQETMDSFSKRENIFNFPTCQTRYPQICELRCKQCNIAICASCVFSGDHEHHQKEDIFKYLTEKRN